MNVNMIVWIVAPAAVTVAVWVAWGLFVRMFDDNMADLD